MIWIAVLGALIFLIGVWSLMRQPATAGDQLPAPEGRARRGRGNGAPAKGKRRGSGAVEVPSDQPPVIQSDDDTDEDDVEITLVRAALPTESLKAGAKGADATGNAKGAGSQAAPAEASAPDPAAEPAVPKVGADDEDASGEGDMDVDVGGPAATTVAIYPEDEPEAAVEEPTQPVIRILVSAHAQTDQGLVRKRNEDSFLVMDAQEVFVVADGMGGYAGGKVASELAVATIREAFEKADFGPGPLEPTVPRRGGEIAAAVQLANGAIYAKARTEIELSQMGTTIVAARFSPAKQRVYIAHVGDSRAYRLRDGKLRRLTTDHTMKHLGFTGPGGEHLYRAVGIAPAVDVDLIIDKPRADDVYLLCSDGLTKMAKDAVISKVLIENVENIEAAVYSLIEIANDRGGKDNVTCIVVKVVERMPPPEEATKSIDIDA